MSTQFRGVGASASCDNLNLAAKPGVSAEAVSISVVIPCRNGADVISRQLEALRVQDCVDEFEIIVANNGSDDPTVEVVLKAMDRVPNLRVVDASHRPGINVARNAGVRAAVGQQIILCDADDIVEKGYVRAFTVSLTDGAQIVGGALISTNGREEIQSGILNLFNFLPHPTGASCAFLKKVWIDIGGFDEQFAGGSDEVDFFWRAQLAGYHLTECPKAVVRYTARENLSGLFRQQFSYGRSQVKLYSKFAGNGMPRTSTLRGFGVGLHSVCHLLFSVVVDGDRSEPARRIACRLGRLVGSFIYGHWYP